MFDNPLDIAVIIFALLSSIVIIIGSFSLTIKLLKTRQTYGISLFFTLFITFACAIWVIYGSLSLIDDPNNHFPIGERLLTSLPILVTNIFSLVLNGISLWIKFSMIYNGKKNNMTEKQYCDLFYSKRMARLGGNK